MTVSNPSQAWIRIAIASISVNVAGLGSWIATGSRHVNRDELPILIDAHLDYPYTVDRELVREHILNSGEKHESDDQKRHRIREMLDLAVTPRLDAIDKRLARIEDRLP